MPTGLLTRHPGPRRSEHARDSAARRIVAPALVAAMLAASAWVSVPIGTVPLTLQVLLVVLAALILRPGQAAAAVGVYVLLGAIGAPVFSGGQGGIGVLLGPTGGYLWGFWVGAVAGSAVRLAVSRGGHDRGWARATLVADVCAAGTVIAVTYLLGWLQLATVTGMSLVEALAAGVVPFIVPDVAKAVVAIAVAGVLRRTGVVDAG